MKDLLNFNADLFHFLRPEWLWLFLPLLIVVIVILMGSKSSNKWQKLVAAHLRPYLIQKGSRFSIVGPLVLYIVAISIFIIALAGPTWEKIEVPGAKSEAILLIGLDLSRSMLVEDVSPDRLQRAKFKIRDLLEANPGSKVGLFVYAGSAHPVITPCKDYKLVEYQLESLTPEIMPVQGTSLAAALELADTIFTRTEAPSTLLLVTDEINLEEADQVLQFAESSNDRVEIMTLATPQGGRIPSFRKGQYFKENNEFVISKLNQTALFNLQQHSKINVHPLTMDDQDVESIATTVRENLVFSKETESPDDDWKESGYGLMIIGAFFFVFWFRKGWMLQWCLLIFVLVSCQGKIESWDDLWYTKDYQGQKSLDNEEYEQAADEFTSLQHKGVAYYKAGNYEAAIEVFSQDSTTESLYNLAIAYAANGQNELAQEALLLAQAKDPDNPAIKNSIEENEMAIMLIDSLRTANPEAAISLEKDEEKGELNERRAQSEDEELSSDTEVDELPQDGDRVTDEMETEMRKAEELEKPPEDFQPGQGESAQNVLLREISADPSEFLRRRFKFQYEKYYKDNPKPAKPW